MESQQQVEGLPEANVSTSSTPETHASSTATSQKTSRHAKRLTLNFPIVSPTAFSDQLNFPSPAFSATDAHSEQNSTASLASPVDSTSFLTSIASQERRVLELKEELQRAEDELTNLKKQWALYESTKKRTEVSVANRPADVANAMDEAVARSLQLKRLEKPTRKSSQRVFSSSRHARTLSLLSPTSLEGRFAEPKSFEEVLAPSKPEDSAPKEPASTVEEQKPLEYINTTFTKTYKDLASRRSLPPPSRDVLVKTGKQMASDLKEGFWTFVEDIRQATVGEEGINATDNRTLRLSQTSRSSLRSTDDAMKRRKSKDNLTKRTSSSRSVSKTRGPPVPEKDHPDSFWKEFGLETPGRSNSTSQGDQQGGNKKPESNPSAPMDLLGEDDHWDLWDSPIIPLSASKPTNVSDKKSLRHSSSTIGASDSNADSASTSNASPRTSTSSILPSLNHTPNNTKMTEDQTSSNASSIPWPDMKKFSPYRLSRTVSDLMKEWEIHDPEAEEAAAAEAAQANATTDRSNKSSDEESARYAEQLASLQALGQV